MTKVRPVPRMSIVCKGGRTKAAPAGETDINLIVERAQKAGFLQPPNAAPRYADVAGIPDLHSALSLVKRTPPGTIRKLLTPKPQAAESVAVPPPSAEKEVPAEPVKEVKS